MEYINIILIISLVVYYLYKEFDKKSYFLRIWLNWDEVFELFQLQRNAHKLKFVGDVDELNISSYDDIYFEYYITTKAIDNGGYKYSAIFDQTKRYFISDSEASFYGNYFESDDKKKYITCSFKASYATKKSGLDIVYVDLDKDEKKVIAITFDSKYLKQSKVKSGIWGILDDFEIHLKNNNNPVSKLKITEKSGFAVETGVQPERNRTNGIISNHFN